AVEGEALGHAFGEVAAAHVDLPHLLARVGAAHFHLDALGGGIADHAAVLAAHEVDDRLVEAVAADPYRIREHHAVEGQDGHLGGPTADIHHHGATGFLDRHPGTNGRRHGLLDQEHLPRSGALGGFPDGALLHLGGH